MDMHTTTALYPRLEYQSHITTSHGATDESTKTHQMNYNCVLSTNTGPTMPRLIGGWYGQAEGRLTDTNLVRGLNHHTITQFHSHDGHSAVFWLQLGSQSMQTHGSQDSGEAGGSSMSKVARTKADPVQSKGNRAVNHNRLCAAANDCCPSSGTAVTHGCH